MQTLQNKLLALAGVAILAIAGSLMNSRQTTAQAAGSAPVTIVGPLPVPVTGNVGISGTPTVNVVSSSANPLIVRPTQVQNSFTITPTQISIAAAGGEVPPDPSGTQYAISSLTIDNASALENSVTLTAYALGVASNNNCRFGANAQTSAPGPIVRAAANSTVQLTFPTPFITAAVNGTFVCLMANGQGNLGVTWSATGYKILP